MKQTFLLLLALNICMVFNLKAQDNSKIVNAKIIHVTVFSNGAQINSTSDVSLTQGINLLTVQGLSPYIDNQSIQVKGRGKFTVLSVSNEINYLSGIEEKSEIEAIRKKIETLTVKSEDLKLQIGILKEEESFLIANKNVNGKQENLDAANFKTLFDFYKSSLTQIRTEVITNERKVEEITKEILKLQQQLQVLQSSSDMPSNVLMIAVKADAAVIGKLEISYMVQNAGWYPSYDLRVTNLKEPVSLTYKANVFQNTGVDWNNVKLTFSNANPNKSGNVPVLNPYFLDYIVYTQRVYQEMSKKSAPSMMKSESIEYNLGAEEAVSAPVGFVATENTTSIEFNVDVPYSLPSEGKSKSIEMMNIELPSLFEYQSVPKFNKDAFLVAKIYDWGKYDLMQGEANLYFENTYVGKSFLNVSSVTDTLNLSLGSDMGIILKRDKRKNFTSEKFIGNNKVVTFSWEISVRNTKSDPVKIKISDQVPVSQNKEIIVDVEELSGGKLEAKTGFINWNVELKAGETKSFILTYTVKYPKDKVVNIE